MRLRAHGDGTGGPVRGIEAHAEMAGNGLLRLSWRLDADLAAVRLPKPAPATRADGLWRHTCFEAFIGATGAAAYCELNISPSGEWAAWGFTDYRIGMTPLDLPAPPKVSWRRAEQELALDVAVPTGDLLAGSDTSRLRLALSAVIEEQSGTISYWALRHPPGKPDFHHSDGFVLELAGTITSKGADTT